MKKTLKSKTLIALTAICLTTAFVMSCNVPTRTAAVDGKSHGWRGPNRDGIFPATGLLREWAPGGPEMVLKITDIGGGYGWTHPVVVGDRIFITANDANNENEIFFAFTTSGEKLFSTVYGAAFFRSHPGARSTPTIVGDRAFVISGEGEVVSINLNNGNIEWRIDGNDFGRQFGTWGTVESPLVFDNKVIFSPGGDQTAMMAIDATNGDIIWKSPSLNEASNFSSPILIEHNGVRQIVAIAARSIFGVNAENGEIMWAWTDWGIPSRGTTKIAPNSPIFRNGRLFISNGYDLESYMWQMNDDLTDITLLWQNVELDTHHGGQVVVDGVIFGSNWFNNNEGYWVAVDWYTGETLWEEPWYGGKSKGSIIAADGMLIIYDDRRGYVGLVRPSRDRLDVVSEFRITQGDGPHWTHPVVHNGILYIRHGSVLMGFNIAGTATTADVAHTISAETDISFVVGDISTSLNGVIINGVRWATRNTAAPGTFAASPTDAGKFFQWNRPHGWEALGNVSGWDGSTTLDMTWLSQNDPCPAGWRVPTREELQSLNNAGSAWVIYNDTPGRVFGVAPNQIFLPAAGFRSTSGALAAIGSVGDYWSNERATTEHAWTLWMGSSGSDKISNPQANGMSLRCVGE
jgi:hypothetical protein